MSLILNKKLAVVLKADKDIGTGHLMRVKSLLRHIDGVDFYLFTDSLSTELEAFATEYKSIIRGKVCELVSAIKTLSPDLILIDHYFLDYDFEKELFKDFKIAVIDDLERRHMCHVLFDQGRDKTELNYKGLVPENTLLCVGYHYNFIKPEFAKIKTTPSQSGKLRVLVNFGGSDPAHACLYTVESILKAQLYKEYEITVYSGISNPDHDKITELLKDIREIKHFRHCNDILKEFEKTDLAVGACGGMFVERILARLPAINVEIADNQKGCGNFVKNFNLGVVMSVDELKDEQILSKSLENVNRNRSIYAHNCANVYDSCGLLNVAEVLKKFLDTKGSDSIF